MPRKSVAPTLFIGLGGTGQCSLREIKSRVLAAYGQVPPMLKFLSLDSAPLDSDASAVLNDWEFVHLEVADVNGYRKVAGEFIEPWMDFERNQYSTLRSIGDGAKQIRMVGRLSLFHNLRDKVLPAIDRALGEIDLWNAAEDPEFERARVKPQIALFGSIAGGTGSGTLIDLAAALRSRPSAREWSIAGYLMMPGVFRGKPLTHFVEENAYAFLKEIEFLQNNANSIVTRQVESPEAFEVTMGEVRYTLAAPFDSILLVDNVSAGDRNYGEPSDLAQAIGISLYALSGASGQMIRERLVNCANKEAGGWHGGAAPNLETFGVAELHYPSQQYAEYGRRVYVARLAEQMQLGQAAAPDADGPTDVEGVANAFLQSNNLLEKGEEQNQILDTVLPLRKHGADIPERFGRDIDVDGIWARNGSSLQSLVETATRDAQTNASSLVERVKGLVGAAADEAVRTRGGQFARAMVSQLSGYFASIAEEMAEENARAKNIATQRTQTTSALKGEATAAAGKLFGRTEAVRAVLATYRLQLSELGRAVQNQARTNAAYDACNSLVVALGDLDRKLEGQMTTVSELAAAAAKARDKAGSHLAKGRPFEKMVLPAPDKIDLPAPDAPHFYKWLREVEGVGAIDFWTRTASDALRFLETYAEEQQVAEGLANQSLADVMRAMDAEGQRWYLELAKQAAMPLLNTNDSMWASLLPQQKPSSLMIVAAPEAFFGVLTGQRAEDGGQQGADVLRQVLVVGDVIHMDKVTLEDKDHAFIIRRFGAVTPYSLTSIDLLMNEYKEFTSNPNNRSLHLDKRWDSMLGDIDFPDSGSRDMWVWALAVSDIPYLSRVKPSGTFYSFARQTDTQSRVEFEDVRLGNGRVSSRDAFLSNREFVAQTERFLQEAVASKGNSQVIQDLGEYMDRLGQQRDAAKAGKDRDRVEALQAEYEAVDKYRGGL